MQAEVHPARLLGECEKVAAKVIEHKLSEKLCNNCSSQAFTNDKNTRPPRHGLEGSFIYHKEAEEKENTASSDCVCFTEKPMLCMGRPVNMNLFTLA